MNNRAPSLALLPRRAVPWGFECDGDDPGSNDQMIKKSDGMGKEGLRKGVFISGDYGKRREAYRERERKRASVSSVTAFSTVSMGWRVAFSRKEALWCFVFPDGVPESGKGERLRDGNRVTELETQCDFVIS